jgi:hypothetical protein
LKRRKPITKYSLLTSAEVAGIKIKGKNKWIILIQNASMKKID